MNLISMNKKYRRRGGTEPVRVLCVDHCGDASVVYLDEKRHLICARSDGAYKENGQCAQDLVEYIEPKMVPLGPEDIYPSFRFKWKDWEKSWASVVSCNELTVKLMTMGGSVKYKELQEHYLINRNDGKGWVACEKPAQE